MQSMHKLVSCAVFLAASLLGLPSVAEDTVTPVAVAPQYDTTHVYVSPENVNRFVQAFLSTFGGKSTNQVTVTVTPTPSTTTSQLLQTPVGTVSLFGFLTPAPYPFGLERSGYLVADMPAAILSARASGAEIVVAPFADPIGLDAVIRWPGGVNMQLYWHTAKPSYGPFTTVPENRVYVSADAVDAFLRGFLRFSGGKVAADDPDAPGVEIGDPSRKYRRIRVVSAFGRMTVLVTDGHLPYPFGLETTGYEVADLAQTLERARSSGTKVLVGPFVASARTAALVEFPGGYIAEVHAPIAP